LGLVSLRMGANRQYAQDVETVQLVNSTAPLRLKYAEVRFSNLCNLACRTCTAEYSSRLAGKVIHSHPQGPDGLLQELLAGLNSIEMFYFLGGEPLLHLQHYDLLGEMIARNRTDIVLNYDTNLTVLGMRDHSVLQLWQKFSQVQVNASIDALGARFDHLRPGSSWSVVEKNLRIIKVFAPHVRLNVQITVSALNVLHLPDLCDYLLEQALVKDAGHLKINIVHAPEHYHVRVLPTEFKQAAWAKIHEFKRRINHPELSKQIELLGNQMSLPADVTLWNEFKAVTRQLDNARNEATFQVFPELAAYL